MATAAVPSRRVRPYTCLRAPLAAHTWRRTGYALVAVPVGLVSVPLALVGGPAGRLQRWVAHRLLHVEVAEPVRTGPRALLHAVLAMPLNMVTMVTVGYGWSIAALNLAYPVRPLIGMPAGGENAWGGPSMAGAWAFHALTGGLAFLLAMPWIVRGLTWVQGRLVRAMLG